MTSELDPAPEATAAPPSVPRSAAHIYRAQKRHPSTLSRYYWGEDTDLNRKKALAKCRRLSDNVGSGRALGSFFKKQRVVSGDRFRVKIVK